MMERIGIKVIGGIVVAVMCVVGLSSWMTYRDSQKAKAIIEESWQYFECGSDLQDFACEVLAFQTLTEQALVWRGEAQTYLRHISEARRKVGKPLTSEDLTLLHKGVIDYMDLRTNIMAFAYQYRSLSKKKVDFDASSETGLLVGWKVRLSIAAALVLYDNYLIGIEPFRQDGSLRRIINEDNHQLQMAIDQVTLSFLSRANMMALARGLQLYDQIRSSEKKLGIELPEQVAYLDGLILGSPTYHALKARVPGQLSFLTQNLDWLVTALADRLNNFRNEVIGNVSGRFGNAVGMVELRKGLMYAQPELTKRIASELKPLDILLEKTPFRLTDALIPGHWGHVAVWVGTPEELIEMGIWDHPSVKPHQLSIRQGKRVIEALRSGVVASDLNHFLNVDDFAVLRPTELSLESRRRFLIKSFEQLGKEYDFNFDVETDKKIVCSELIYVVFDQGFEWPTEKMMGRATISPDHVVRAALDQPGLDMPILYHKGQRISGETRVAMKAMVDANLSQIREIAKYSREQTSGQVPTE